MWCLKRSGDWVSNGLGCANYMIGEPEPRPSLWTTSSKRTTKMKYSWHHLNVQILPPYLCMSCTLHSSRAQLSATQFGYFKLLKMHFLVVFPPYKCLLYSTCYFCIRSACCMCHYRWNYFDSTFPIILPLEKINIFEKEKKRCVSEKNWLKTRFIKTGWSASLPYWPSVLSRERTTHKATATFITAPAHSRFPIKTTSGLFLRQHHPRKQTTRAEQMPPGATWRNSLYIALACQSVWKTVPSSH